MVSLSLNLNRGAFRVFCFVLFFRNLLSVHESKNMFKKAFSAFRICLYRYLEVIYRAFCVSGPALGSQVESQKRIQLASHGYWEKRV